MHFRRGGSLGGGSPGPPPGDPDQGQRKRRSGGGRGSKESGEGCVDASKCYSGFDIRSMMIIG